MHLRNFVLAFCLISAIHCARFKRDDNEEPVKEPEKEIEKEPSNPKEPSSETGSGGYNPPIPDFGAWFGQFYGSGNKDWISEAQKMFQDPSKWDPSKWDTSKWMPKLPSK